MTSQVDATFPPDGEKVSKAMMRSQFATAKTEISALQARTNFAGASAFSELNLADYRIRKLENKHAANILNIPTIVADSGSDTDMTEAILLSSVHEKDPAGAISYQVPTGTEISDAIAGNVDVGDSFEFTLINTGNTANEDITLTVDTGVTFVGSVILAPAADDPPQASSATWIVRNTTTNTWVFHRK